jgi:hypothetical protein
MIFAAAALALSAQCHYSYTVWNVKARKSLIHRSVSKPYGELTRSEKGPLGCTPCEEDQADIVLSNGVGFKACRKAGPAIKTALDAALAKGQKIVSVVAYRPQVSKGPADASGNRTELSNHSFGAAVDLNEEHNGLYDNCPAWSKKCALRKGGAYRPGADPLSLSKESPAVVEMKKAGFLWGGEIEGRQKDFMHFSPTGY